MANLRDWQKAILARLQELLPPEQIYEEGVPDEAELPMYDSRRVKPYVVAWWGQRVDGGLGFNTLCGVRENAHTVPFILQVCGPTGPAVRDLAEAVSDLLLGFKPLGEGELREDGAGTIRQPLDMSGVNSRYQVPVSYVGTVDV